MEAQRLAAVIPVGRQPLRKREGWGSRLAVAHLRREPLNAPLVLSFEAELFAGEEPLGTLARTAGLDVCGLSAGLPSAGDDDRSVDGGALLAVDVLGIGEPQVLQLLAGEAELAPGAVEADRQRAVVLVDVGDLAACSVLDPGPAWGLWVAVKVMRSPF